MSVGIGIHIWGKFGVVVIKRSLFSIHCPIWKTLGISPSIYWSGVERFTVSNEDN